MSQLFEMTIPPFIKSLQNFSKILDKAAAHADAKKFEASVLLNSRLAPDQFPLTKQVQIACDSAKLYASRLGGKDAPVHDDKEQTLKDLKARIDSTVNYLKT